MTSNTVGRRLRLAQTVRADLELDSVPDAPFYWNRCHSGSGAAGLLAGPGGCYLVTRIAVIDEPTGKLNTCNLTLSLNAGVYNETYRTVTLKSNRSRAAADRAA